MKWPLGNSGGTYLRYVTDTVQTLQYSNSQCSTGVRTAAPKTAPDKPITFDLSLASSFKRIEIRSTKVISYSLGQLLKQERVTLREQKKATLLQSIARIRLKVANCKYQLASNI